MTGFALIGAATLVSAAMQSPIVAITLAVELTHSGLALLVPIVLAAAGPTVVSRSLVPASLCTAAGWWQGGHASNDRALLVVSAWRADKALSGGNRPTNRGVADGSMRVGPVLPSPSGAEVRSHSLRRRNGDRTMFTSLFRRSALARMMPRWFWRS